jgi:hypothetical protein
MADAQAIANALTAALQPMVAAITAATAAAVAPAAAAPQGPVAAVAFARTPAQARADLLNYELPGDAKIFASATVKLATTFSLNKPNVSILLAELGDRSNSASWTTTLQVDIGAVPAAPGVAAIPAVRIDLLQDYGRLTLTQLRVPVMAYQAAMDRHAQNGYQFYLALTNSVDEDTKGKMQREKGEFMTGAAGDVPSGMLYFKKLMMKAEVDSRAMASHIRDNLGSLDTYILTTANSNISDFNDYVRNQMAALSARGETTHDLLNNLFKAYARAECEEFRDFVKDARRDWERNRRAYEPEILMNECHDEYNRLLLLSRWGVRTEQEEHIITLRAEIAHLKAAQKKAPKLPKGPSKPTDKFSGKWKWKMDPPNKGEPQKKEFEGKQYHWCPGHQFWTMHSPTDCTVLHPEKKITPPGKKTTPAKKLTFAEAAIAAMEEEDQEEGQGESEMEE